MKRVEIKALFAEPERYTAEPVTICGWVRTLRSSKALGFIELNDGSYFSNLQVVFEENKLANYDEISRQNVGAALGLLRRAGSTVPGVDALLPDLSLLLRRLMAQAVHPLSQGGHLLLGLTGLLLQGVQLLDALGVFVIVGCLAVPACLIFHE